MIQAVLDLLLELDGHPHRLELRTGARAESSQTFRARFELVTGLSFTPRNFRAVRLGLLDQADAMIVIRTGLSESGAFELAYNIFGGKGVPVFFAIWRKAPIETTLLRDMDELVPTRYATFNDPAELREPLLRFFRHYAGSPPDDGLSDTWPATGNYGYGFAFDRRLLDPAVGVDEGGESG